MLLRLLTCVLLLGGLVALPFYFRKADRVIPYDADADVVVVVSPHSKANRDEYEAAFRKYYRKNFQRDVRIDFRTPGGTSDINRFINDRFRAEFRHAYEKNPAVGPWRSEYADIFSDASMSGHPVRRYFLESDIGIGIDVFCGGGSFEHSRLAKKGFSVDAGVKERHPEYFVSGAIPAVCGGEALYDPAGRYYGVVLSTFGIFCNLDLLRELAIDKCPERWRDLGEPHFFNQVVLADPTKSGSANKCCEIIVQECMAECGDPAMGWELGLNLLKRIFANARYLTDGANAVVPLISSGEAAAGMVIDTYGISEEVWSRKCFPEPKVRYITPVGGTAVSTDPVMIFRGAPNRKAAERFVDFLLSPEGQKLHCFLPGTPDGPEKNGMNRPPVLKTLYEPEYQKYFFRPGYNPYASGSDFQYRPELTGKYYTLLSQVIKSLMMDVQDELRSAWQEIIKAGGPERVPEAMACFNRLPFRYSEIEQAKVAITISSGNDAAAVSAQLRRWSEFAKSNYQKAAGLAAEGR